MSIEPKEVAALAILAQSPQKHGQIVRGLRGAARQIGQAMVNPNRRSSRYSAAAKDIRDWAQSNKRLAERVAR